MGESLHPTSSMNDSLSALFIDLDNLVGVPGLDHVMREEKVKRFKTCLRLRHLRSCLQDRIAKHISNRGKMILVRYCHVITLCIS